MAAAEILKKEYCRRKQTNASYSLRSYARDLGVSPATLSQVFTQKREVTRNLTRKMLEKLSLPVHERKQLSSPLKNSGYLAHGQIETEAGQAYDALSDEQFSMISEWYHYAILSLAQTTSFSSDPQKIAERLGIEKVEAEVAIARLIRLGLFEIGPRGRLILAKNQTTTSNNVPSAALRRHHSQQIQSAERALYEIPVQDREITSITFAMDPAHLDEFRAALRNFRRKLIGDLESRPAKEVFVFNCQLFPVSKPNRTERASS